MRRASGSSRPTTVGRTSSSITPASAARASTPWPRARRSPSRPRTARRDRTPPTFSPSNPATLGASRGGGLVRRPPSKRSFRKVDEDLAGEPRWEEMSAALREEGIVANDASLLALPLIIESDDEISAELGYYLRRRPQ